MVMNRATEFGRAAVAGFFGPDSFAILCRSRSGHVQSLRASPSGALPMALTTLCGVCEQRGKGSGNAMREVCTVPSEISWRNCW